MKRKVMAMVLSMVLGVSAFGVNAQAAVERVTSSCSHLYLSRVARKEVGYEQAAAIFHNIVYEVTYECESCHKYWAYTYEYEWENCVFNDYRDGHCYCSLCGNEDEDYRP